MLFSWIGHQSLNAKSFGDCLRASLRYCAAYGWHVSSQACHIFILCALTYLSLQNPDSERKGGSRHRKHHCCFVSNNRLCPFIAASESRRIQLGMETRNVNPQPPIGEDGGRQSDDVTW